MKTHATKPQYASESPYKSRKNCIATNGNKTATTTRPAFPIAADRSLHIPKSCRLELPNNLDQLAFGFRVFRGSWRTWWV
jgi:hypothetical protein